MKTSTSKGIYAILIVLLFQLFTPVMAEEVEEETYMFRIRACISLGECTAWRVLARGLTREQCKQRKKDMSDADALSTYYNVAQGGALPLVTGLLGDDDCEKEG